MDQGGLSREHRRSDGDRHHHKLRAGANEITAVAVAVHPVGHNAELLGKRNANATEDTAANCTLLIKGADYTRSRNGNLCRGENTTDFKVLVPAGGIRINRNLGRDVRK